MKNPRTWPDWKVAELKRLKAEGLSQSQIADAMQITRSAVAGEWKRQRGYVRPKVEPNGGNHQTQPRKLDPEIDTGSWDHKLVEPYAQFKLRKQREREAARCRG